MGLVEVCLSCSCIASGITCFRTSYGLFHSVTIGLWAQGHRDELLTS